MKLKNCVSDAAGFELIFSKDCRGRWGHLAFSHGRLVFGQILRHDNANNFFGGRFLQGLFALFHAVSQQTITVICTVCHVPIISSAFPRRKSEFRDFFVGGFFLLCTLRTSETDGFRMATAERELQHVEVVSYHQSFRVWSHNAATRDFVAIFSCAPTEGPRRLAASAMPCQSTLRNAAAPIFVPGFCSAGPQGK